MRGSFFEFSSVLNSIINATDFYNISAFSDFTLAEQAFLSKIVAIMEDYANDHHVFLEKHIFKTLEQEDIPLYLVRSTFEYVMLLWVLLLDELMNYSVDYKFGQVVSLTIEYSFVYPKLFSDSGMETYDVAIENRTNLYDKILRSLYSNKENYQKRLENLFCITIDNPLIDIMKGQMGLFEDFEYLHASYKYTYNILIKLYFETYMVDTLSSFPKELKYIINDFSKV